MLGLLIGIYAKSQVNANNLMMPFVMLLSLVPTLSTMNETLGSLSHYLHTGIVTTMLNCYSQGLEFRLGIEQALVLALGVVGITALFVGKYRKILVSE